MGGERVGKVEQGVGGEIVADRWRSLTLNRRVGKAKRATIFTAIAEGW